MCTIRYFNDANDISPDNATVLVDNGYGNVDNKLVAEYKHNHTVVF